MGAIYMNNAQKLMWFKRMESHAEIITRLPGDVDVESMSSCSSDGNKAALFPGQPQRAKDPDSHLVHAPYTPGNYDPTIPQSKRIISLDADLMSSRLGMTVPDTVMKKTAPRITAKVSQTSYLDRSKTSASPTLTETSLSTSSISVTSVSEKRELTIKPEVTTSSKKTTSSQQTKTPHKYSGPKFIINPRDIVHPPLPPKDKNRKTHPKSNPIRE